MKTLDMLIENAPQIPVEKLAQDSRAVSENTMFFCIKGQRTDGHIYAAQAAESGASVIVHSDDVEKLPNVVYLRVEDTMKALNEITDKFYDYPSKQLQMIGVTGTNILKAEGLPAAFFRWRRGERCLSTKPPCGSR